MALQTQTSAEDIINDAETSMIPAIKESLDILNHMLARGRGQTLPKHLNLAEAISKSVESLRSRAVNTDILLDIKTAVLDKSLGKYIIPIDHFYLTNMMWRVDRDVRSKKINPLKLLVILSASFHSVTIDDIDGKSEHDVVER